MEQCPRCGNDKCSCPSKSCKCSYDQIIEYKKAHKEDLDISWWETKYGIVSPYIGVTDRWGSYFWNFLHVLTYLFPEDGDRTKYREVVKSVVDLVPIGVCSGDAMLFFEQYVHFDTKEEFIYSMIEFHNVVNRKLGKKEFTKEEAISLWNSKLKPIDQTKPEIKQNRNKGIRQRKRVNGQLTFIYE